MVVDQQIIDIEHRAQAADIQMAPVLRDAGVAATTWWRWRNGAVEPKLGTLRRVREALDRKLTSDRAA